MYTIMCFDLFFFSHFFAGAIYSSLESALARSLDHLNAPLALDSTDDTCTAVVWGLSIYSYHSAQLQEPTSQGASS